MLKKGGNVLSEIFRLKGIGKPGRSYAIAFQNLNERGSSLRVLRDTIGLTGTKYGCGIAQCGACSVLVDGQAMRSCQVPVESVVGQPITTIEAIAEDPVGAKIVEAWVAGDVPQCGYCQSGQVVAATALLRATPKPSDADIAAAMTNLCRCGTYLDIAAAVRAAAAAA